MFSPGRDFIHMLIHMFCCFPYFYSEFKFSIILVKVLSSKLLSNWLLLGDNPRFRTQ